MRKDMLGMMVASLLVGMAALQDSQPVAIRPSQPRRRRVQVRPIDVAASDEIKAWNAAVDARKRERQARRNAKALQGGAA